jgi:hypothetical protein
VVWTSAIEVALALAALATGLWAARLWWRSSQVKLDLGYHLPGMPPGTVMRLFPDGTGRLVDQPLPTKMEPVDPFEKLSDQMMATWDLMNRVGPLNARAASWTATSVGLSAFLAIAGALSTALPVVAQLHVTASKLVDDAGLVLAAGGAVLLFAYGIPFGQRTRGVNYRVTTKEDEAAKRRDRRADRFSYLGLALGLIGVVLQGWSIWL